LFQLCTGHIVLGKHLFCIAKTPMATCQECQLHKESIHHFLLVCQKYAGQRIALSMEVGPCQLHIKYLLNERKSIKATLKFRTK
ncbi:hypothetical protein BDR04DRAFT_951648, partial [Suillus decipiens]